MGRDSVYYMIPRLMNMYEIRVSIKFININLFRAKDLTD